VEGQQKTTATLNSNNSNENNNTTTSLATAAFPLPESCDALFVFPRFFFFDCMNSMGKNSA
jgi:hypothetical protein